ncbi:MAG: M23 family metallopeptidase, partial [Myxococcota bacterium]
MRGSKMLSGGFFFRRMDCFVVLCLRALGLVGLCVFGLWSSWSSAHLDAQRLKNQRFLRGLRVREGVLLEELERLDRMRQDVLEQKDLWEKRVRTQQKKVARAHQAWRLQQELCDALGRAIQPRLRMFYRVSRLGHGRILLGSQTLKAMATRWRLLRFLTERDMLMFRRYHNMRLRLGGAARKLVQEKKRLQSVVDKLGRRQRQLCAFQEKRRQMLTTIYQEAEVYQQALRALRRGQSALGQMLSKRRVRRHRGGGILAMKGRLSWPVASFTPYCARYELKREGSFRALVCVKRMSKPRSLRSPLGRAGILLPVPEGTPVQSVAAGKVVYRGWRHSYGQVLIVDHGHRFYSVYAHLSECLVKLGQLLSARTILGLSGKTGALGE